MKPIYFPFTFISKQVVEAISACFEQTVVYQISSYHVSEKMLEWNKNNRLEIRMPVEGNEKKLDAILKDFQIWAKDHQGSEIAFLKTQAGKIPYFAESSPSQIRAEIKRKSFDNQSRKKIDDLFNTRLFLLLAQEFDLQNYTLNKDLLLLNEMEQNLMSNLKGENKTSHKKAAESKALETDDPGYYMPSKRIEAWAHLMQRDQQTSALFVTSSRSAFEHLLENASESEELISFDSIPVLESKVEEIVRWQDGLMETIEIIASNDWLPSKPGMFKAPLDVECDRKVSLTLNIIPGEKPHKFFARCIEHDLSHVKEINHTAGFKNTIIGLIEYTGFFDKLSK